MCFLFVHPYGLSDVLCWVSLDESLQQRKPVMLTNGINTKSDIEAILNSEARKRGLKLTDIEDRQGNGALSLKRSGSYY